jgi:hypothetical protein
METDREKLKRFQDIAEHREAEGVIKTWSERTLFLFEILANHQYSVLVDIPLDVIFEGIQSIHILATEIEPFGDQEKEEHFSRAQSLLAYFGAAERGDVEKILSWYNREYNFTQTIARDPTIIQVSHIMDPASEFMWIHADSYHLVSIYRSKWHSYEQAFKKLDLETAISNVGQEYQLRMKFCQEVYQSLATPEAERHGIEKLLKHYKCKPPLESIIHHMPSRHVLVDLAKSIYLVRLINAGFVKTEGRRALREFEQRYKALTKMVTGLPDEFTTFDGFLDYLLINKEQVEVSGPDTGNDPLYDATRRRIPELAAVGNVRSLPVIRLPNGTPLKVGIPISENGDITIPHVPVLVYIRELDVTDRDHPDPITLHNVPALFCHGSWDPRNEQWIASDGRAWKDVLLQYHTYAEQNDWPKVEFVISCNTQNELSGSIEESLGDFFRLPFINRLPIAQAVLRNSIVTPNLAEFGTIAESFGAIIGVYRSLSKGDEKGVDMVITNQNGIFINLDQLHISKQVNIVEET